MARLYKLAVDYTLNVLTTSGHHKTYQVTVVVLC